MKEETMDIRVQELLEKIRKEGVDSAEASAAKILADAEEKRASIISQAEKDAKAIVSKAQEDASRTEESGRAALTQASRDLILAFKGEMEKTLAAIINNEVSASYDASVIKEVLPRIIESWAKSGNDELVSFVSEKDLKSIEEVFKNKLNAELKKGVELKPLKEIKSGFRISDKDGKAYYDFSAPAVAEMISTYLNSKLASAVAQAIK